MVAEPMGALRQTSDAGEQAGPGTAPPSRHRWGGGSSQAGPAEAEAGLARDRAGTQRGGTSRRSAASTQRLTLLTQTIEAQVVPRLVLAGRITPPQGGSHGPEPMAETPMADSADVMALTDLVLASDVAAAAAFCEALHAGGLPLDVLYLDLLAPTARRLGQMWTEDTCTFTDVTLGMQQLRAVLQRYGAEFAPPAAVPPRLLRRALLVPAPGEQHGFGLAMVAEFFRRAGWDVWSGPIASRGELVGMVGREFFAVIGFSVSCDGSLDALATAIRAVRRASRNPAIGIMVGGPAFIGHPELAALVGADATAADGSQATLQAEALLALLASRA